MNCIFEQNQEDRTKKMDYAMPADFCRMFEDRLAQLYTLSLLLTADRHKAEQCLVAGLDDCLQGNPVFREWAHSWAKRTVVKNAIRIIMPLKNKAEPAAGISEPDTMAAAITSLKPLDRFVYVLSVLEKYSDRECSMLLDCTVEKIVDARIRALQRIASVAGRNGLAEMARTGVAEELRQVYGEAS